MARGINDYGYDYPSLSEIIDETKDSFKEAFGENFNTSSNSVSDKIITLFSEREYQLWLLGGMVYSAQTIQGAEGIYLDDLLSKRGIYREGKTKATGQIQMYLDRTVPYTTTYPAATYTINSGDFVFQTDTQVAGNIAGHRILNSDLSVGSYVFTIVNTTDGSLQSLNLTLASKTPGSDSLNTFFSDLKNFIVDNTVLSNSDIIIIDTTAGSMYIGFSSDLSLVGLNNNVDFRVTPQIGTKILEADVIASEAGELSVEAGAINSISPTPSGFVSITNIQSFVSGSDSETDAEYKARALQSVSSVGAATRPAVIAKLLSVEGVQRVKIFSNPTPNTDSNGVPPYKFIPVVYGGTTEAISNALYEVIALSNATFGTTSFDINTEDGQVETIYHTKATVTNISARVTYKTVNGKTLSADEVSNMTNALTDHANSLDISGTLYNIQLVSEAANAVDDNRLASLKVEVKLTTDPDSAYSDDDFVSSLENIISLSSDDVSFVQV